MHQTATHSTRIKSQLARMEQPWAAAKTSSALANHLETLWDSYASPDPKKSMSTAMANCFSVLAANHYTLWQELGSKLTPEDDEVMASLVQLHSPRLLDRLESTLHTIGELHNDTNMAAAALVFYSSLKMWRNSWSEVVELYTEEPAEADGPV